MDSFAVGSGETLPAPHSKTQSVPKQILGLLLAAVFMYVAFRSVDLQEMWRHMQHLNMLFVSGVGLSCLCSHLLRAFRWRILLEPVAGRKISFWNSFCAIMYGYLVNILLPRGGEVVRLVTISRAEKLSVAGVLPTLFIDRILDMAMLALLLGITLFFLPAGLRGAMPWLVPGGIGLCAATALGFIFLPFAGRAMRALLDQKLVQSTISKKLFDKLTELSSQFDAGTKSLTNPIAFPAIGGLSLAIWFCYWLSFYLMIGSFDLFHQVQPGDILIVFAIASAGALVPTPGSAGTFHLLVTQTLVMVSHIDRSLALAVATTLHLFCFVLVICVLAGGCFMLQSLMGKFLGRRQIKTTVQGGSTDR